MDRLIRRRFIVIGHRAKSSPEFPLDDLCGSAGRWDVLLRCINSCFFISHNIRKDSEIYLVLVGNRRRPRTIRLIGSRLKYLNPDERSTAALIRTALMKGMNLTKDMEGRELESTPGIYVSNAEFEDVVRSCSTDSDLIYLKEDGEDIRNIDLVTSSDLETAINITLVLGDDKSLSEKEEGILNKYQARLVALGPNSLHADHCIILVHNELDRLL